MAQNFHIAIIGAGLSGLALALALHQHNISCEIYEARDAPLNAGGGLMLTANGLRVLNSIGVYELLKDDGYTFNRVYIQHGATGAVMESIEYGNIERHGFQALRVYRSTVLKRLLDKVIEQGIPVHFGRRFSHVVSESQSQVTWQFVDGSTESASLLIGADGIYSRVREYIAPEAGLVFNGFATVVAAILTAQLDLPAKDLENLNDPNNKHPFPSGIIADQLGAFVLAPQTKNGDEIMIAAMRRFPQEPENGRWTQIDNNKEELRRLFRQDADKFPEVVQNAVKDIPGEQLRIWPSYRLSQLERWTSANGSNGGKGRVMILGDAAHAIPPSAGQGVNMAFEDVWTLALLLARLGPNLGDNETLQAVLYSWQLHRQSRVDGALRLNQQMELRRLPAEAQAQAGIDRGSLKNDMVSEFENLFSIDYAQAVDGCLKQAGLR